MDIKNNIVEEILFLFNSNQRENVDLLKVILVTCIVAFFELLSVGFLIPFLTILSTPSDILVKWDILFSFNIKNETQLISLTTLLYIFILLISTTMRKILLNLVMKITFLIGFKISTKIFSNVINQNYEYHLRNNSSFLIDAISSKTNNVVYLAVMPFINLISSLIIFLIFAIVLLFNFPFITIISISFIALSYFISIKLNRKNIALISKKLAYDSEKSLKITQETFSNIKEIIINNYHKYPVNDFTNNEISLRKIQGQHSIITLTPKIFIELFGLLFIILFAFYYSIDNPILQIMPTLAALAFASQKILPLMQQSYASWTSIKGAELTVREVVSLLKLPSGIDSEHNQEDIDFNYLVSLKNISYKYSTEISIFKNFNLEIKKNEKLCIVGASGKGKSTLVNLLMGLIKTQTGEIFVDGSLISYKNLVAWQKKIAHVPQNIFFSDDSILKNLTLGMDGPINLIKIHELLEFVELNDFINSLPMGLNTNLGEVGSKLSGGQKQKIGIARALYKNSEILILDESTNSLDNDTEERIIFKLSTLSDKTVILITHKLENYKYFHNIINIA